MQTTGSTQQSFENPSEGFAPHSGSHLYGGSRRLSPGEAAMEFFSEYARQRPEVVAMWAFGVGFVLGWKLKPW